MKKLASLIVLLGMFVGSIVASDDLRPAYILHEYEGEVYVTNVYTGDTANLTEDIDGFATSPMWGGSDYVTFVVSEQERHSRRDLALGEIVVVNVETLEITEILRCQLEDVQCALPQMNRDATTLVFTAIRTRDDYPVQYLQDLATGSLDVLQSGDIEVLSQHNKWIDNERFVLEGRWDGQSATCRVFNTYEGTYSTNDNCSVTASAAWAGPNWENVGQVSNSARTWVEVTTTASGYIETLWEHDGWIARGNPWRVIPPTR